MPASCQFLRHHIACDAGRVAGERGGSLETLLQVKAARLDFQRVQRDAGATAAARFLLRHGDQSAAEAIAAQALGQEHALDRQLTEIAAAVDAADNRAAFRICWFITARLSEGKDLGRTI